MDPTSVTRILQQIADGDNRAVDELLPVLYGELKRLANYHLDKERPDHTLQPTALVHEAYLKMAGQDRMKWKNKAQFMAIASKIFEGMTVRKSGVSLSNTIQAFDAAIISGILSLVCWGSMITFGRFFSWRSLTNRSRSAPSPTDRRQWKASPPHGSPTHRWRRERHRP